MTRQDSIIALADEHITDRHDVPTFREVDEGLEVTVQCYGPLAVEQFCGFGMAVGTLFPTAKILGPEAFADYKIRILL